MKRFRLITLSIIMVFALSSLAFAADVMVKSKEGLGAYLTDGKGMTLYYFKKDAKDISNCKDDCVKNWPLFYAEKLEPAKGLDVKEFGSITRADGKKQSTFRGYPLYYFFQDKAPGDTKGQGVKDIWSTIDPATFMKK
jgi:predicted lipoprotein with Yx(FWY)xxD motif